MTEPLTPADCDLRGLPFMPLDVVRLGDSDLVALSTGDEFKAAVMLWCKCWLQIPAASLPDDDRILAHLSGAGPRWRKLKEQALRGFIKCADGRLYHPVIAQKAREAWEARIAQRARAAKRWDKQKQGSGNAEGDAVALPADMQGTGRGNTVDKSTGAEAPPDPDKTMFDAGVRLLMSAGKTNDSARTIIAKWRKDHGAAAVIEALGSAQREGAINPISWIEARWRSVKREAADAPIC